MDREEVDDEDRQDIEGEYRELTKVTVDDETYVTASLKVLKIFSELGGVNTSFWDGEITAYEALVRLKTLLDLTQELNQEIKSKI